MIKTKFDDLNAILNWKMDNGLGHIDQYKDRQEAADFNHMGKAFLANSLISLFDIIEHKNSTNEADTLIFPTLFNVWHFFELLLKSGILALEIISNPSTLGTNRPIKGHNISPSNDSLILHFKNQLIGLGLVGCAQKYLPSIESIIDGFDKKNALFDFCRYSYDIHLNPQFYNQPDSNNRIFDNTYINIHELTKVLISILDDFVVLIEELNYQIESIDINALLTLTDTDIVTNIDHNKKFCEDLEQIIHIEQGDYYEFIRRKLL